MYVVVQKIRALLVIAAFGVLLVQPSLLWASGPQAAAAAAAETAAIKEFHDNIATYLALRNRLRSEVRGPVKDSSSSQVTDASDALAGAIERARQGAHVGSIFTAPAAKVIKLRIADAVKNGKLESVLADIDDEGTAGPPPKVHLRLPVSAQLATMPPSLLNVLPPLPKEIEYRIMGRYLVVRDVDASLILDYIAVAVPR